MPERKFVRLWITVLLAVVLVFAGNGAWAWDTTCQKEDNKKLPAGECVNLFGYDVWVNRGESGLFPVYDGKDSIYSWNISSYDAKYNVGHLDIEIPSNIEPLGVNDIVVTIDSCPLPWSSNPTGTVPQTSYVYPPGKGDPATSFGTFEYDQRVLKIIPASSGSCAITRSTSETKTVNVTFKNKILTAGLDEFLVKAATKGGSAEALHLLGPSLSSESTSPENQPPLRSTESFRLGDHNCRMDITLNSDGSIANASVQPFIRDGNGGCTDSPLEIKDMSITLICKNDGSGQPVAGSCKSKTFVERNIIDKSDDESQYCYYTTKGQQVCKTI
jgi:hypothetical protein